MTYDILQQFSVYRTENEEINWDWTDSRFINDKKDWDDISIEDTYEGVGRLIHETQELTEYLIRSQARYLEAFKDGREQYTFENLDSNETIQDLRNSTLGTMMRKLRNNVELEYKKDEDAIDFIIRERNYFVHRFYYDASREGFDINKMNKSVRRLKQAISTIVKFKNRYVPFVEATFKNIKKSR